MSSQAIIDRLGGRNLEQIVPAQFRERFGLSVPGQYGMVCGDVAAEIRQLEALGSTPFLHAHMGAPNWTEQGVKKDVRVEMSMGYVGAEQIEVLGAGENTDFYTAKIPADGSLTLHHACCFENNIEELKQTLPAAGYPLYLEGGVNMGFLSTYFAYFDTREELGLWLEIGQYRLLGRHRPPTEKFITRLAGLQRRFGSKEESG